MTNGLSVSDITPLGERPADIWRGRTGVSVAGTDSLLGIPMVGTLADGQVWVYDAATGTLIPGNIGSAIGWFVITDYGAVGNGTTDDTTAVNDAITAACGAGGGVVYFPPGTYKVTGLTIACNALTLQGDGRASVIAMSAATGDTVSVDATSQRVAIGIRGLTFAPSVTRTAGAEIKAANFFALTLDELYFTGAGGHINSCIDLGSTSNNCYQPFLTRLRADSFSRFVYAVRLLDLWASEISTDANTAGATTTIIEGGCESATWSQCDFVNSANNDASGTGDAVLMRATDYSTSPPRFSSFQGVYFDSHEYGFRAIAGKDITFTNCWFSARPGHGAYINGSGCENFVFVACRFENCGANGLRLAAGSNHQVIGCTAISNNQQAGGYDGIGVDVITHVTLIGNRAYNRGSFGGAQLYGIGFTSGATDYLTLEGNDFSGNATGTINNLAGVSGTHQFIGGSASMTGGSATTYLDGTGNYSTPAGGAPSFATPALTLGTANAAGAASTVIRSDATILVFDSTVGTALGTASSGSGAVASRVNHVHPNTATGVKWTAGTSMPGSPSTNDRVTRTDLGIDFFYDGTRWLSVTLHREPFGPGNTTTPDTGGTAMGRMTPWGTAFDLWLVNWDASTYVATTNDGTHYWTVNMNKHVANDTGTVIDGFNTSADTVNEWTRRRRAIGAVYVAATYSELSVSSSKTSTPGNIYFAYALEYRLIGT